jgi:ABC-type branched-subunit amino acid transport system substrate-binding protein
VLVAATALAAASMTAVAGAQGGGGGNLEATEKGVTEDTITVSVVAAIDVPGFPGLFQGNHNGVDAWAEYVNDNGGLAGREVKVNHFDPKLSGDEARAAFRQACEDSFAILGTGTLLLQNFDDITQCTDKAGAVTGLPDFAVTVTEPNEQCSPSTFAINPPSLQCDTKDQDPQTYVVNTGPTNYYVKKFGDQKGGFLYPADSASAKNGQVPIFEAQGKLGIENVYEEDLSALAPQSAYTSVVGSMRDAGATYAKSGLAFDSTVKMRKEAATQGVDMKIWDCSLQCYDPKFVAPENVDAIEGQYVYFPFLPFLGKTSEASQNKMLKTFLKYIDDPDGFSDQAFSAGLFFQQAVEDSIQGDNNALTRKGVLEAAANIHDFDAGGMMSPTDVGGRKPNSCFVLTQVKNGEFERVYPTKKGTFDCNKKNRQTIKLDLTQ